jgi:UBX domain-containing protein 6
MSAIKRFFEKKKLERKFKKAGAGHALDEQPQQQRGPTLQSAQQTSSPRHQPPSDGAVKAAEAAMSRAAEPKPGSSALAAQKAKIRLEMEAETSGAAVAAASGPVVQELDCAPMCRVLYRCPLFDDASLPKDQLESKIEKFLNSQLEEDPIEAAALLIKTSNKSPEKVQVGIDTMKKILQNIISHPGEEKYLKIRLQNKTLEERVFSLKGARDFLIGADFHLQNLQTLENTSEDFLYDLQTNEDFLVMDTEQASNVAKIEGLLEVLENAEPIVPILDSDARVFYPTSKITSFHVPDEFFAISPAELKREQQLRQEATEKFGMVRTKAMRERDEQRELRTYRYTVIRARFPDGVILQGTFRARSCLKELLDFIRESMTFDWIPFSVVDFGGSKLSEDDGDKMLAELRLVPSAVVNLRLDEEVVNQCKHSSDGDFYYVKDELLAKIEYL